MNTLILIKENKEADRDGVVCFLFYRGTRYNWTTLDGGLNDFDKILNNRTISLFGN